MKKVIIALAATMSVPIASAATIAHTSSTGMQSNGFGNAFFGPGTAGGGNFENYALIGYSVQDILAATGLTVGDLATQVFTFSFTTDGSIDLTDSLAGSTYTVSYVAVNDHVGVPFNPEMINTAANGQSNAVDSGITDQLASQTISVDLIFSDVTTLGGADPDWVGLAIAYRGHTFQGSNTYQPITSFELTTIPEPTSAFFAGLGSLLLLRRRR